MIEFEFLNKNHKYIAGADEVGRGPLAGPVVAASVVYLGPMKKFTKFCEYLISNKVTDSKKLSDKLRRQILENLGIQIADVGNLKPVALNLDGHEIAFCICEKDHKYIDENNILKSSLHAMRDAFISFNLKDSLVLFDGNKIVPIENNEVKSLVKGDSKSPLIGLASIIAKIYRDDLMFKFSKKYPHYDFEKNAGYPTAKHRESILRHGICKIHRKTFKGVSEFVAKNN